MYIVIFLHEHLNLNITRDEFLSSKFKNIKKIQDDEYKITIENNVEENNLDNNLKVINSIKDYIEKYYIVPNWTNIRNSGVFCESQIINSPFKSFIIHKNTKGKIFLNRIQEKSLYELFKLKYILSKESVTNFWNDFINLKSDRLLKNTDITDFNFIFFKKKWKELQTFYENIKEKYKNEYLPLSIVQVDNVIYPQFPYIIPEITLLHKDPKKNGKILYIQEKDIIINNNSKEEDDLKTKYKYIEWQPNTFWSCKWYNDVTDKYEYSEILFDNNVDKKYSKETFDEEDVENEEDHVSILYETFDEKDVENEEDHVSILYEKFDDDDESSSVLSFNSSDFTDSESSSTDSDSDSIIYFDFAPNRTTNSEDIFFYHHYELKNLPASYLLSEIEQWYIFLNACKTNYQNLFSMNKVSDKLLQIIKNLYRYKEILSPRDKFILKYINKRIQNFL
jgi:hypothetical protein